MGKLVEILESGGAPGYAGTTRDSGCPQVAIPRALREMEQGYRRRSVFGYGGGSRHEGGMDSRQIQQATQYSVKQLKSVWIDGRKKKKTI